MLFLWCWVSTEYIYLTFLWKLYRSQAQNGSIWPAPDLLCLLGPVQKSKVVTMSTFLLHGTLHGGLGRLCQTPSQMSRMSSRASNSIQWNPRVPHKLHFNEISWTSCRNHRYSVPYLSSSTLPLLVTLLWTVFRFFSQQPCLWILSLSKSINFKKRVLRDLHTNWRYF